MFDVIKDFRSLTNKLLIDYNKFKKWLYSGMQRRRRAEKLNRIDPRRAIVQDLVSHAGRAPSGNGSVPKEFDRLQHKLNKSNEGGRLTEDLLSEVKNVIQARNLSPTQLKTAKKVRSNLHSPGHISRSSSQFITN